MSVQPSAPEGETTHIVDAQLCRKIFDRINDGVFAVDTNCMITLFNLAAERITGYKSEEAVGRVCYKVFHGDVKRGVCALRETLDDQIPVNEFRETYITKEGFEIPIRISTMLLKNPSGEICGALGVFRDESEILRLRRNLDREHVFDRIVTSNSRMERILNQLPDIAQSECSVLIEGPSGSGKELIAQAIHDLSPRRFGPYIKLNCAALPDNLLESEMFGYEKGAFTDAKRDKPGIFQLANGGTLLLDEIANMDRLLQVKLLRVLNDGEFQPLGSSTTCKTDARIIASTNENLQRAISQQRFRSDLYYRINVVSIEIPSLRERPEDIPLLVNHFLRKKMRRSHRANCEVSPKVYSILTKYSFPGNVRELENAVEHGLVMCSGDTMLPSHLPQHIVEESNFSHPEPMNEESERSLILDALDRHKGNHSKAAEELGMHRTTLWRKLKGFGTVL